MEQFIAQENIRRYKLQLQSCTDQMQKAMLEKLLAEEEAKLRAITLHIRQT